MDDDGQPKRQKFYNPTGAAAHRKNRVPSAPTRINGGGRVQQKHPGTKYMHLALLLIAAAVHRCALLLILPSFF